MHDHAQSYRGLRKVLIFGQERQPAAGRKLKISRVIGGQPLSSRQGQNLAPGPGRRFLIDRDRQIRDEIQSCRNIASVNPAALLRLKKHIAQFQMPEAWHDGAIVADTLEQSVGLGGGLVLEAPGQGNGGVDDRFGHGRPLSRSSFQESPPSVVPLRRAFSFSKALFTRARSTFCAPTSRATGLPCLVISTSSPAATRSSSAERCVFASKAPTVIIAIQPEFKLA